MPTIITDPMTKKKWFENWFDSPYYHILYQNRNDDEAEFFMDNLCAYLKPSLASSILDVACGRGRHAFYLNKKGYEVTGIDLSQANISFAEQFKNKRLHFKVHDVRHIFKTNCFDIVLNLFTSFGYFETEQEHIEALKALQKSLKEDGVFVLDYFNTQKIINHLSPQEVKCIDDIDFYISKHIRDGKIIKHISFEHRDKKHIFEEEVKAFTHADFENLFAQSGFRVIKCFGDYSLNDFDVTHSDRLIFICKKVHV